MLKKIKLACQLIVNNITDKELKNNNRKTQIQLASDSRRSSIIMKVKEEPVEQVDTEERQIVLDNQNFLAIWLDLVSNVKIWALF